MEAPAPPPRLGQRRRRVVSEEAAGVLADRALHAEAARRAVPGRWRVAWRALRTLLGILAALYLFTLALKLLSASAGGVAVLLQRLSAESVPNLVGFGWLAAYGALSGSPVAALALSLLDGGAIAASSALAMLAGSRMGASLIVLLVGFVAYTRGRGRADGVYVGVVALLTTFSIYIPATPLAIWLLDTGALDGPARVIPTGWADLPAQAVGPAVRWMEGWAPGVVLFAAGAGVLLAAFAVFDRLLPNLDPPSERFERLARRFRSPRTMLLFGGLVTSLTMSVSLSVTILVPLTLKNYVRRADVVPYVMGANITTFLDTLFASLLLDAESATVVVLAEMLAVTAVSALVLIVAPRPYIRGLLRLGSRVSSDRRWFAGFLVSLGLVPLALLLS
ncbi:MAG: hypothetical protein GEU80_00340 [Dehalococcoidia bacterium]|nr:hypothetical protein [Dehalococcoidia bacterium]